MARTAVAIGTFDGVHCGHQAILAETRRSAESTGSESVAYTFDLPPRAQAGDDATRLLLPSDVKRRLLRTWVDRVVEARFPDVRSLGADAFVDRVLVGDLGASTVVVGDSFRFGRDRAGDALLLARLAARRGVAARVLSAVEVGGSPVSSTRIRRLVQAGDVEGAGRLLGRPPSLFGDVVPGDRIGRTLGFPTANLEIDARLLLPAPGIYFAYAFGPRPSFAVAYVGARPTLPSSGLRCEVHLLAPPGRELYGEALEVHLLRRLREDVRFPSLEALRRQIARDVEAARNLAATLSAPPGPIGG